MSDYPLFIPWSFSNVIIDKLKVMRGNKNNSFMAENMISSDSFIQDDSTFIVMGQSPNIVVK